jgi:effector-binding domain-containing protein
MADPVLIEHQITTLDAQPSVAVRIRGPMDQLDLGSLFATHLPRLHAVAAEGGPPYGRYHEFGPTHADVEIGIPVADASLGVPDPNQDEAPIETSSLPGGPTAVVVHLGSYETLGAAYDRFHDWIHAQGQEDGPGPWESYIDDPGEIDVANLRTALYWPLIEK